MKYVPFEIRLIAFTTNPDGSRSVCDIVETSYHFASHFARSFMRNPDVSSFIATAPNTAWRIGDPAPEWKRR